MNRAEGRPVGDLANNVVSTLQWIVDNIQKIRFTDPANTSDQIDVVILDHQYTPTLLDQQSHRYIPIEAVYCILEVKQNLNKLHLEYAARKAQSVRRLKCTSIPIPHAGGTFPAKEPIRIVAGIVAPKAGWVNGLISGRFKSTLSTLAGEQAIDCGLALSDCAFDTHDDKLLISDKPASLAFFLFRLLKRLQSLGTVPAIDWGKYAQVLFSK